MPHILISGYHEDMNVKQINVHVEVQFKNDYFKSAKSHPKLLEIMAKFEDVVKEYFPDYEADYYSNKEYHDRTKSF